jgi:predicted nucleic acid-binding protein
MLRLVLDTNVWLDWLVFDDPVVAPVKAAVAEGRAAVFIDEAVEVELVRVLAYPFGARTLDAQAQANAIAQCLRIATKGKEEREKGKGNESQLTAHAAWAEKNALPKCSDPDDQKFLELALACGAGFLLTRDAALLDLARNKSRPLPYRIVTPSELVAELEG